MTQKNSRRGLDSIDLRLIAELENNPRQRYSKLAAALDIDPSTAKRRMIRLEKDGIIFFTSFLNTAAIGYNRAVIGLNVPQGFSESIANELAHHALMLVMITSGRYDITAWATYKDPETLFDFIHNDLSKIPNIESVEIFPVMKELKFSFTYLGNIDDKPLSSKMARELDENDWDILAEIEKNPRITNMQISSKLGITRQTAANKLNWLLDEDVVRIVCIASYPTIGYGTSSGISMGIFIKSKPKNTLDVAEHLKANKSIYSIVSTTGRYNLMAGAVFRNQDEISDFHINELGTLPGILSSETIINLKAVSSPFSVRNARLHLQKQET